LGPAPSLHELVLQNHIEPNNKPIGGDVFGFYESFPKIIGTGLGKEA
jgi:hypothetical protein